MADEEDVEEDPSQAEDVEPDMELDAEADVEPDMEPDMEPLEEPEATIKEEILSAESPKTSIVSEADDKSAAEMKRASQTSGRSREASKVTSGSLDKVSKSPSGSRKSQDIDLNGKKSSLDALSMEKSSEIQKSRISRMHRQCQRRFRELIGKREMKTEELEKQEGALRQRLNILECSMPAVMVWNIWRMTQCGTVPSLQRVLEKQFQGPASGEIYCPSTPSRHFDCRVREVEAERKQAQKRVEEARALWAEKMTALEERQKNLDEAKKIQEERRQKIQELTTEVQKLKEAATVVEDDGSCETGECGVIQCKKKWLEKVPSSGSIKSTDLECLEKLQELAETELSMKRQIAELERREEAYMRTLQQADELWSKLEGDAASTLSALQEQLEMKTAANQQMADRICQLEDVLEKMNSRLVTCRDELENFMSIERIEVLIGRDDDFAEVMDQPSMCKAIMEHRMIGMQYDLGGVDDKDVLARPDLADVGIKVEPYRYDKDALSKEEMIEKYMLAMPDVDHVKLGISPEEFALEQQKLAEARDYLARLGSLSELDGPDDYLCPPDFSCNDQVFTETGLTEEEMTALKEKRVTPMMLLEKMMGKEAARQMLDTKEPTVTVKEEPMEMEEMEEMKEEIKMEMMASVKEEAEELPDIMSGETEQVEEKIKVETYDEELAPIEVPMEEAITEDIVGDYKLADRPIEETEPVEEDVSKVLSVSPEDVVTEIPETTRIDTPSQVTVSTIDRTPDKDISVPRSEMLRWKDDVETIRVTIAKCSDCTVVKKEADDLAARLAHYTGTELKDVDAKVEVPITKPPSPEVSRIEEPMELVEREHLVDEVIEPEITPLVTEALPEEVTVKKEVEPPPITPLVDEVPKAVEDDKVPEVKREDVEVTEPTPLPVDEIREPVSEEAEITEPVPRVVTEVDETEDVIEALPVTTEEPEVTEAELPLKEEEVEVEVTVLPIEKDAAEAVEEVLPPEDETVVELEVLPTEEEIEVPTEKDVLPTEEEMEALPPTEEEIEIEIEALHPQEEVEVDIEEGVPEPVIEEPEMIEEVPVEERVEIEVDVLPEEEVEVDVEVLPEEKVEVDVEVLPEEEVDIGVEVLPVEEAVVVEEVPAEDKVEVDEEVVPERIEEEEMEVEIDVTVLPEGEVEIEVEELEEVPEEEVVKVEVEELLEEVEEPVAPEEVEEPVIPEELEEAPVEVEELPPEDLILPPPDEYLLPCVCSSVTSPPPEELPPDDQLLPCVCSTHEPSAPEEVSLPCVCSSHVLPPQDIPLPHKKPSPCVCTEGVPPPPDVPSLLKKLSPPCVCTEGVPPAPEVPSLFKKLSPPCVCTEGVLPAPEVPSLFKKLSSPCVCTEGVLPAPEVPSLFKKLSPPCVCTEGVLPIPEVPSLFKKLSPPCVCTEGVLPIPEVPSLFKKPSPPCTCTKSVPLPPEKQPSPCVCMTGVPAPPEKRLSPCVCTETVPPPPEIPSRLKKSSAPCTCIESVPTPKKRSSPCVCTMSLPAPPDKRSSPCVCITSVPPPPKERPSPCVCTEIVPPPSEERPSPSVCTKDIASLPKERPPSFVFPADLLSTSEEPPPSSVCTTDTSTVTSVSMELSQAPSRKIEITQTEITQMEVTKFSTVQMITQTATDASIQTQPSQKIKRVHQPKYITVTGTVDPEQEILERLARWKRSKDRSAMMATTMSSQTEKLNYLRMLQTMKIEETQSKSEPEHELKSIHYGGKTDEAEEAECNCCMCGKIVSSAEFSSKTTSEGQPAAVLKLLSVLPMLSKLGSPVVDQAVQHETFCPECKMRSVEEPVKAREPLKQSKQCIKKPMRDQEIDACTSACCKRPTFKRPKQKTDQCCMVKIPRLKVERAQKKDCMIDCIVHEDEDVQEPACRGPLREEDEDSMECICSATIESGKPGVLKKVRCACGDPD